MKKKANTTIMLTLFLSSMLFMVSTTSAPVPGFILDGVRAWHWEDSTYIDSVAVGDVDGDGSLEIVTGGYYEDSGYDIAQLAVWDGTLNLEGVRVWNWGVTYIDSVAIGDVDGDGETEIVTGGYYWGGTGQVAQLVVWDGATLALEGVRTWYWVSWTVVSSVAIGDVDGDGKTEIITGGWYWDGTHDIAQLVVWDGVTLAVERVKTWYLAKGAYIYSVAVGDVDGDGSLEIVTGGNYWDYDFWGNPYDVAQLVVWDGATLAQEDDAAWSNAQISSVAIGNVDGDGATEIVTGGTSGIYYAQLAVRDGSTLAFERGKTWNWGVAAAINSVAIGDVDGEGKTEIITGGDCYVGTWAAQLVVWDGATLAVDGLTFWYWVSITTLKSVAIGDVDGDGDTEIVTGGTYLDGTPRYRAQLAVWEPGWGFIL